MLQDQFGIARDPNPLQMTFLRWQCRVRQMAMRDQEGRPDDAITPAVYLPGEDDAMGHIITLLNKSPGYSVTAELDYMAAKTNDPAQRRDQALQFLAAGYYQNAVEFSDILTATFPPGSEGAKTLHEAGHVTLVFEAFNQRFDLKCKVWRLAAHNPLHAATIAHNRLFNPALPPGTEVLGFEPDWDASSAVAPGR
ncbi:hypothetical protein [Roseovarius nubinhibens]|nr:hypothetical protein [Roseovarius nubinhibens]|tara:strand:+ start:744 stop:1328 length:585 start_codon:yes stop_codon:yes gene_type:complete